MLPIAVVLGVLAGVLLVLTAASSLNVDYVGRVAFYAALLGVAIVAMGLCSVAMFVVLYRH